ncbi:hypothetical protein GQ43DRAFT_463733 [Delitschia confertaspora ATCC 74209]|uniref:Diphthamide biosynthesis protein 4 n=1 Tax=Delitschia confertaspora ATCC 74209 TaxID=1513339 RepID=A0A9P4JP84_9PLEO|nr:hypothetical protein GQ43DRAFT_463733 [Delitschia confertaspora ATCC 74209]
MLFAMAPLKNYYTVLGLPTPSYSYGRDSISGDDKVVQEQERERIKKAYRRRMLECHPDKVKTKTTTATDKSVGRTVFTVDEIKEAYAILSSAPRRAEWAREWRLYGHRHSHTGNGEGGEGEKREREAEGEDEFVLGLEYLDLDEDFTCLSSSPPSSFPPCPATSPSPNTTESQMQWTRPCRCGSACGFRVSEEELERCVERGEKEVLVGCAGCSLWVRVGFEVLDGEEG